MRYFEIVETRSSALEFLKKKFPNTPDYVVRDFLYKNYKHRLNDIEDDIVEWLNELTWTKQTITVTIDIFDSWTQTRLKQLIDDDQNTRDTRYKTQQDLVKASGVSKEPIILTLEDGEYVLQEGWHRTVAALKAYPQGYKQIAYIGK